MVELDVDSAAHPTSSSDLRTDTTVLVEDRGYTAERALAPDSHPKTHACACPTHPLAVPQLAPHERV